MAILAIVAVLIFQSFTYPFKALIFPWIILIPLGILSVIQVMKEWAKPGPQEKEVIPRITPRSYLYALCWFPVIVLSLYFLGFYIGIPLFVFAYVKTHGEKWALSVGLSLGIAGCLYGLFEIVLAIPLYYGLLFLTI